LFCPLTIEALADLALWRLFCGVIDSGSGVGIAQGLPQASSKKSKGLARNAAPRWAERQGDGLLQHAG
jgi:hypothetical protein